jgi:uncharacterized protein (TIGR03083 family)
MTTTSQRIGEPSPDWDRPPDQFAYRTIRENVSSLLVSRPEAAGLPVPTCPDWTVRDAVSHLVEICWMVHGRLSGGRAEPSVPVAGLDVAELLAEWAEVGPVVEELIARGPRGTGSIMMMDAFTHELDIRRALGLAPPAEHPSYPGALAVVLSGFSSSIEAHGLPALRIETTGAGWRAGTGEPAVTVRGDRRDLFRSLSGRRTLRQIGELSWSGPVADPVDLWSPAFTWGPFRVPVDQVEPLVAQRIEASGK